VDVTSEQIHQRIRELTEARTALERRLGELSAENDRLRLARDRLFADHSAERAQRQASDVLLTEAAAVIGRMKDASAALPEQWRLGHVTLRQATEWEERASKYGVTRK
jgi:hypothetical protein